MPTTLFVLVNAVINAFRLVDHLFILTRGGPDNASTLLLYHLYEVGFKFWDTGYAAAITVVLVVVLAAVALLQFFVLDKRCTTNERRTHCPAPCAARAVRRHLAGHAGRLAAGPAVDTAAGLCVLDGLPSARILGTLRPGRALDAGELSPCLAGRALCALFPEHGRAGGHDFGGPAGAGHAGRLCLCALPLSRPGPGLCPGAGAADDHAGHPAGGELPDPVAPGRRRYAAGHRPAVLRIGLCHLPAAPDLPGHSRELDEAARVEGASTLQILWRVYVPLARHPCTWRLRWCR